MINKPLHLGILQADSVMASLRPKHGDYPAMFREVISSAAEALGMQVQFSVWDILAGDYPASTAACDAWLITGSKQSVYEDDPWIQDLAAWVQRLHDERRKLIGICFGHQLVAHCLGGLSAAAEQGWCVGVQHYQVQAAADFMTPARGSFKLIASHQDQVMTLPPAARLLAGNDSCPYAMYQLDEHILCLQGHPEFQPGYSADLLAVRRKLLGAKKYEAGVQSLAMSPDRQLVGQWILNFISATPTLEGDNHERRHEPA